MNVTGSIHKIGELDTWREEINLDILSAYGKITLKPTLKAGFQSVNWILVAALANTRSTFWSSKGRDVSWPGECLSFSQAKCVLKFSFSPSKKQRLGHRENFEGQRFTQCLRWRKFLPKMQPIFLLPLWQSWHILPLLLVTSLEIFTFHDHHVTT
jgi:hypothetical protein